MVRQILSTTFTDPRLNLAGFSDDFNRPDGVVVSTPAGKAWEVVSTPGTPWPLMVVGNAVKRGTGGAAGRTAYVVESYLSDGHLRVTVGNAGDHSFALLIRFKDIDNYVVLTGRVSSSVTNYSFVKRIAGATTQIASAGTIASNSGDQIDVVLSGTQITIKVNGATIFGGAKNVTEFATMTRHGILLQSGSSGNETIDQISMTRN